MRDMMERSPIVRRKEIQAFSYTIMNRQNKSKKENVLKWDQRDEAP